MCVGEVALELEPLREVALQQHQLSVLVVVSILIDE